MMTLIFRRWPAALVSSNLAIGTATAFVLATAVTSLAMDRQTFGPSRIGPEVGFSRPGWTLRGTLAPAHLPSVGASIVPPPAKRPKLA